MMDAENASNTDELRANSWLPLWILAIVMSVSAAVLFGRLGSNDIRFSQDLHLPWWVLVVAFAMTERWCVHFRFRGNAHTASMAEIVLVVGLFAAAPSTLFFAAIAGGMLGLALFERQTLRKAFFNLAHYALGAIVAIHVMQLLGNAGSPLSVQSWAAAVVACLAGASVSLFAVWCAVVVCDSKVETKELVRTSVWGALGTIVNTMLGLVVVIECAQSMAAATLLVAPILVVFVAYRAYISERSKSEGLQFLYLASEALNGEQDLEDGLLALLEFARSGFHADIAEIVLRGDADESIGYRTVSGPGERAARLEPSDSRLVQQLIDVAGSSGDAVVLEPTADSIIAIRDGLAVSSALLATLRGESGVHGAVVLARGREAPEGFDKSELRLFETFANHLGLTLEKERLTTSLARLRKAEQELAHQAYHDSLTGLANRVLFRDRVDDALAEARDNNTSVAVMFIDLDDFKTVNDTRGHAAGDALLVEVAARLSRCVGGRDTAARLGGDEFAVLLRGVAHESQVHLVANSILAALRCPIDVEGDQVVTLASIGIALQRGDEDRDAAELMRHADVAMYTAKRNGKGRFDEFEPTMSLTVARRHQLKVGLERAVGGDEFVVEYQPVIDAATAQIVGTEALLRWLDPAKGVMRPSEFVAVAEETGLIVPIGRQVLREACARAAAWAADNPKLQVFVNLSARQLAHPDIVHDVANALSAARLDAARLVLEVTETAMMRDIDQSKATLNALKGLGVKLAIDDFGTGFSSLSYLRELPVDVLKIAKPIIDAICDSAPDAGFVKGIIELGHVVGLRVVAEGVERAEQYAHLIEMDCDLVQGHYYAASMTPEDFTAQLRKAREARKDFEELVL
jgi:diguanylate cyclase (GGDEF)-like protein